MAEIHLTFFNIWYQLVIPVGDMITLDLMALFSAVKGIIATSEENSNASCDKL